MEKAFFVITAAVSAVPSLLVALIVQHYFKSFERKAEKREDDRKQESFLILKNIFAIGALAEATGKAVKDGHTNGEMTDALKYYGKQKNELKDYMMKVTADSH